VPEETGIYRGEVLTIMGALADIRSQSTTSSSSWRKTMKRKRTRRTPEERAASHARAEEQARKLRELVAKGEAELEAKRAAEALGQ
jgi:hypothetical protein